MKPVVLPIILIVLLTACGPPTPTYRVRVMDTPSQPNLPPTQRPYTVNDEQYRPIPDAEGFREEGLASWYGKDFHGRKTSNGEIYDMYAMTAAHKHLPLPTYVEVRNLENGRSAIVRVNDRGPFIEGRMIDLSRAAFREIAPLGAGILNVEVTILDTSKTFRYINNLYGDRYCGTGKTGTLPLL